MQPETACLPRVHACMKLPLQFASVILAAAGGIAVDCGPVLLTRFCSSNLGQECQAELAAAARWVLTFASTVQSCVRQHNLPKRNCRTHDELCVCLAGCGGRCPTRRVWTPRP
jgi:hypothetical protein